jgi:hypothetical protein
VGIASAPRGKREARSEEPSEAYKPDHRAKVVLSGLGLQPPAPDPSDALNELVTGAVADYVAQNEADWDEAVSYAQAFRDRLRASARRPLPGHA